MTDSNFSAIRARLKYETIEDFIKGYARFISGGGMFIPMRPSKLKPIGTTIRFQFLLGDRTTALLGEGVVLQVRAPDDANPRAPVGMLIKFTKLSQESKKLVDRIVQSKGAQSTPGFGESVDPAEHEKETDSGIDLTAAPTYDGGLDDAAQAAAASASAPVDSEEHEEVHPGDPFDEGLFVDSDGEEEDYPEDVFEAEPDESNEGDEQAEEDFDFDLGFETPVPVETPNQEADTDGAAVLAVAPESGEPEDAEPHDADGQHEDDPTTREAPSAAELEPPTAESHVEADVEEDVPKGLEEGSTAGPRKLAGTEGGLQVLAFDDMSDEELEEFQAFSFGEEEEEDFDSMFDGLFGGSEAEDDVFGGVFDGPESDNVPSREIELAEDGNEEGEAVDRVDPDPVVPEAELGDPLAESEVEEDAIAFEESLDDEHADEIHDPESSEDVFELENEFELEDDFNADVELGDEESPVLSLDDAIETGDAADGSAQDEYEEEEYQEEVDESEEDDLDALIDFQRSPGGHEAPQEAPAATQPEESNIQALLGSLDDDESEPELTLNIGGSAQDEDPEPEPDDEESLEALLASAQKEIEEKQGTPERSDGDILDQLLDGEELPPPPEDSPTFSLPKSSRKKKKGFLSKFFDKD